MCIFRPFAAKRSLKLNTKVLTYDLDLSLYLDRKFGLSLSEIALLFDSSLDLDRTRTLAHRKAKSKVKV